jgi:hypothetical protein
MLEQSLVFSTATFEQSAGPTLTWWHADVVVVVVVGGGGWWWW